MSRTVDALFRALADPTRRALLDALRTRDGQTLGELEARVSMTRFGVMKHLKVLAEAGLVVSRKVGRSRHHYLNAVTLVEALTHWVEPFVQAPTAARLAALRRTLEEEAPMPEDRPDHVQQIWIRTTPERLWRALTRAEESARYHFLGAALERDLAAEGDRCDYRWPDGRAMLGGEVLVWERPHALETTFEPYWTEEPTASRVRYEIVAEGEQCRLTVLHFGLPASQSGVADGWSRQAASLKSYLETGTGLSFAA